jgi:hypothetical protein
VYTALAARLYDPTNQFWTQAELLLYFQEAMREWNALTAYWRGDFTFNPVAGATWYDLTTIANTLRPLTLTTTNLYTVIEYHLLEPPVGAGPWTGSAQFAISDIQGAVARRRNELLGTTGCSVTQSVVAALPGRTALPSTTLDLRRVAFLPANGFGAPSTLWQDDAWAWESFEPAYAALPPGIPATYAVNTQPLFTFDVDANLNVPGQYELLTTQAGADPSLVVPDDWAWLVKWGALADLLGRESNAKDPLRAAYCEKRYAEGMSLLALAPALLTFRIAGQPLPLQIDAVREADEYATGWEGLTPATPSIVYVAGLNLMALSPPPDLATYAMTATVVENTPVPAIPTDCINVTVDVYEALLDEAQHIAMFKSGGAEFTATFPMHQRFMQLAALYSSKLAEMGEFSHMLQEQSHQEDAANPRYTANTIEEAIGG